MGIYDSHTYEVLKSYLTNEEIVQVSLVGLQARGKTNICKWLNNEFGADKAIYINVNMLKNYFDDLYAFLENYEDKAKKFALILDDISFAAMYYSKATRNVLKWISTIRHRIDAEKYMIVTVFHYPKSALPFLRETPVKIIMSYDYSYMRTFKDDIPPRYLKAFKEAYKEALRRGIKGVALVAAIGDYDITRFPKVESTEWIDKTTEVSGLYAETEGVHIEINIKQPGYIWELAGRTLRLRYRDSKANRYITVANVRIKNDIPIIDEESGEVLYNPDNLTNNPKSKIQAAETV